MRNKTVRFIYLTVILSIMVLGGIAEAFSRAGSGTQEDPYIITNVHQLQEVNDEFSDALAAQGGAVVVVISQTHLLTVSKTGSGTIISSPAGINCGSDCNESYEDGTEVTLTAIADDGWVITDWDFEPCDFECQMCRLAVLRGLPESRISMSCTITVNSSINAHITFERGGVIKVTKIGSGTVVSSPGDIDCGCDCSKVFMGGSRVVTLTANPAIGATFIGWEGDCSGTGPCVVDTSQHRDITAEFTQGGQFILAVSKTGSGTIVSSPAGINCGSDCSESYEDGTKVTLTIEADSGWAITNADFSGSCATIAKQLFELELLRSPIPVYSLPLDIVEPETIAINFSPFEITPDLQVTEIKPIQTIQDIPLIKDKATMVRVFVELSPAHIEELYDVTVELEFEGQKYYETANLIKYGGKLYVVPDTYLNEFRRYESLDMEAQIKRMLFDYGLDAFNFEHPFLPLYPTTTGNVTITAKIDPFDQIGESNEANNFMSIDKKVKSFDKDYKVVFRPMSFWGSRGDFTNYDLLRDFAEYQSEFFVSTYPIPRRKFKLIFDGSIMPTLGVASIAQVVAKCVAYKLQGCDRVVFIIPEGKLLTILSFLPWIEEPPKGLYIRGTKVAVFLDETADQPTLAHEIGHSYGFCEEYDLSAAPGWVTPECGDWNEEIYPCGYLAGDGWDVRGQVYLKEEKRAKISLDKSDPANAQFNYFSFMGSSTGSAWEVDSLGHWAPSNNHEFNQYNTLLEKLEIGADPKVIVVSGLIYDNNTAELFPSYCYEGIPDTLEPGEYSVELLSDSNEVLSTVSFEAIYYYDDVADRDVAPFVFTVPYPNDTYRLVFKHNETILNEIGISANPPIVNAVAINKIGDETYEVIWDANDADGDQLTYSMFYSHTGVDWFPIVFSSNDLDFNYQLETSELPGSESSFVKVVVTDGINTAEVISDPFSVSNKPPSALISRPLNGSVFTRARDVTFEGWAYDPEEFELDGSSFVWTSSIDGAIGTSVSFTTSKLSVGTHSITLSVSDANGLSDSKVITITVLLPGDFNIDFRVDILDLAKFSSKWLDTCSEPNWCEGTDLDYNYLVDFVDFAIFADNWLWERIPPDLNINGDVDFDDYAILANQWRQPPAFPSADIAPPPDGDGIVNFLDLALMAKHWLEGLDN